MRKVIHLLVTAAYLGVVITLTLVHHKTLARIGIDVPDYDELHLSAAFGATLLIWSWLRKGAPFWTALWKTTVLAAAAPFFVEIAQLWVPYRDSDVRDLLPGLEGVAAGILIILAFSCVLRLFRRRSSQPA